MARPNKTGLDYFPFDVDFFEDEKIAAISGEFGIKGELAVIKLLCAVYRNGYFILWNEPLKYKLLRDLPGVSAELLDHIVNRLVRWGFFDEGLFNSVKVLTSRGIQRRYFSIARRRGLSQSDSYILANNEGNRVIVNKKEIIDDKNHAAGELLTTKTLQRKEKESKEKKRKEDKRKTSSSTTAACEAECPETAQGDMPMASAFGSKSECLTPEKSSAKKVPPTSEAGIIPIGEVAEYMKSNVVWLEAFCMNNHLDMKYVEGRIDDFVRECENNGETGKDSHDCMRHFNYWLRKTRRQVETAVTHARSTGRHPATNFNNDKHYDDF